MRFIMEDQSIIVLSRMIVRLLCTGCAVGQRDGRRSRRRSFIHRVAGSGGIEVGSVARPGFCHRGVTGSVSETVIRSGWIIVSFGARRLTLRHASHVVE